MDAGTQAVTTEIPEVGDMVIRRFPDGIWRGQIWTQTSEPGDVVDRWPRLTWQTFMERLRTKVSESGHADRNKILNDLEQVPGQSLLNADWVADLAFQACCGLVPRPEWISAECALFARQPLPASQE